MPTLVGPPRVLNHFSVILLKLDTSINVSSEPVSSVLNERTSILVAIRMFKYALALQNSVPPVALISCPVNPDLLAFAMLYLEFFVFFDYYFHLPCIDSTIALLVDSNKLKFGFFILTQFVILLILLIIKRLPLRRNKLVAKLVILFSLIAVIAVAHIDQSPHI